MALPTGPESRHTIGLRELRHTTGQVIARVQNGETIEVTEHGRPVARIVPVDTAPLPCTLQRMINEGRVQPAQRPGVRPRMRRGDGTAQLSDALAALRDEENW